MIHEWPEGRSNPAGNQEASHLRSGARRRGRGERGGPRGQVYQCILETSWPLKKEFAASCTQKEGCHPRIRPVLIDFFFSFSFSFLLLFVFFFFFFFFFSRAHHPLFSLRYALYFGLSGLLGALHSLKYAARCELV